jgi:hypothetical protein
LFPIGLPYFKLLAKLSEDSFCEETESKVVAGLPPTGKSRSANVFKKYVYM